MFDIFTLVHCPLLFIPRMTSPVKQLIKTRIQNTKKDIANYFFQSIWICLKFQWSWIFLKTANNHFRRRLCTTIWFHSYNKVRTPTHFKCGECELKFNTATAYCQHIRRTHEQTTNCCRCDFRETQLSALRRLKESFQADLNSIIIDSCQKKLLFVPLKDALAKDVIILIAKEHIRSFSKICVN